ncbi:MAG: hypothetical protein ACREL5_04315 [Gemmatimonadales bacterium]
MRRTAILIAAVACAGAACTEHLTTPGDCPAFCPGGQAIFRDTVLSPMLNGDTSFTGYVEASNLISVLASSGGNYGQNRAVIHFSPVGDSILIADTNRAYTLDSMALQLSIQARDTTVGNFVIEIYRLPRTIDSTAGFDAIDALMTPANLLAEVPDPTGFTGTFHVTFGGDSLARLAFAPADSGILEIGLRVRADGPTAARIGTPASGSLAPVLYSYVTALGVPDSLKTSSKTTISDLYFTVAPPESSPPPSLLAVGGIPVSRSFIRFALPEYLRDSATIIRATLQLHGDQPMIGIPADTAQLVANTLLADFGAKSPVIAGLGTTAVLLPGTQDVSLDVASLVQAWQGATPTPSIIRLSLAQEGGTFLFPLFASTRSPTGAPTLRITYRPPFGFEGY